MKGFAAGSISWAEGGPPVCKWPWEKAITDLAEAGDQRFVEILREHVKNGVISSKRALSIIEGANAK